MTEHAVVIAGGGPAGMMLAAELALAGVDVAIVERRASQDLPGSRAGGLHSRTIEVLDQRGIADRFLAEGQVAQVAGFAGVRLDISDFPTRHPYGLGLWQKHIERILAGWVAGLDGGLLAGEDFDVFRFSAFSDVSGLALSGQLTFSVSRDRGLIPGSEHGIVQVGGVGAASGFVQVRNHRIFGYFGDRRVSAAF